MTSGRCPFTGTAGRLTPTQHVSQAEQVFYLVGDRIRAQSDHPELISIAALEALLGVTTESLPHGAHWRIVVGQGVSAARLAAVYERLKRHALRDFMRFEPASPPVKASCAHTHKQLSSNIVITDPEQCGAELYRGRLMLDDACAEMSDHLTGIHVQGVVITEAARQMLLATTEKFHIPEDQRQAVRFVTHSMSTTFNEFIYPLPVGINQTLRIGRRTGPVSYQAETIVRFFQISRLAAEVRATYSVIPKSYLSVREHSGLRDLINPAREAAIA